MRDVWYKFTFRDPIGYFEGSGKVGVNWNVPLEDNLAAIKDKLIDIGYCTDLATGKQFRWYYCTLKLNN